MNTKQVRKLVKSKSEQQPKKYSELEKMEFAEKYLMNYLAATLITLRDEFGFGKKRLENFLQRETDQANYMRDSLVTSKEILETLKQETGFDFHEFVRKRILIDSMGENQK